MADGITPKLGLVKPDVGASDDTWGNKLNENFDKLDAASLTPADISNLVTEAELASAIGGVPAPPNPATAVPLIESGSGSVGFSVKYAREDHVHPIAAGGGGGTGDVIGPAGAVADRIAVFNGTTGKVIKDGGATIAELNVPPPATNVPLMDGAAAIGAATKYAKEDHVHPTDTSRAAVSALPVPATAIPLVDATPGVVGIAVKYAREDHVHPTDTSRAPTANPTFTGLITAVSATFTGVITAAAKGHQFGTFGGASAFGAVSQVDANIKMYDLGGTNWCGFGVDSTGVFWLRAGAASAVPGFTFDTAQAANFVNSPRGPTPAPADNSTKLATTAYVDAATAGGGGAAGIPEGRLTLTAATPVLAASVANSNVVYYTPYQGDTIPLYNGTSMVATTFAEMSQLTTDATKSPAACAVNSNYDIFVWNDAGTIRATRGPAWTSDLTRGAGTSISRVKGLWLNANAITNGPAALRGTYVGTIRTNALATIDFHFGGLGGGGTNAVLYVWNAYNRVFASAMVRDSTASWTYGTVAWRMSNNSVGMRVNFVRGLNEDPVAANFTMLALPAATCIVAAGIGLDSTTNFTGAAALAGATGSLGPNFARYNGLPGQGFHYLQALEYNNTTTASTFYGTFATYAQNCLDVGMPC